MDSKYTQPVLLNGCVWGARPSEERLWLLHTHTHTHTHRKWKWWNINPGWWVQKHFLHYVPNISIVYNFTIKIRKWNVLWLLGKWKCFFNMLPAISTSDRIVYKYSLSLFYYSFLNSLIINIFHFRYGNSLAIIRLNVILCFQFLFCS